MKIQNLTSDPLKIKTRTGFLEIPPSWFVVRAAQTSTRLADLEFGLHQIPVTLEEFCALVIPEEIDLNDENIKVISSLAAPPLMNSTIRYRNVYTPGKPIRDEAGNIIACDGLSKV